MSGVGAAAGAPSPESYLATVLERCDAAERAAGRVELDVAIAGRAIRLRFAGESLVPRVVPAFAHLVVPEAARPALTIHLCDSASTGVERPPFPCVPAELRADGEIPGFRRRYRAFARRGTSACVIVDLESGVAVVWPRDAAEILDHDAALPLVQLLQLVFQQDGLIVVHGGAVGGVLLGGSGGSGKSTTALLCLDAGMTYAGDDHVLVDPAALQVHSMYATGKVAPGRENRFPGLAAAFAAAGPPQPGEKLIAYLGERVGRGFPLRAIALPRVTGQRDTCVTPLAPAAALRALAPSTLFQLPAAGQSALAALAGLVRRVPCHRLDVGTDLAQIPAAVARLAS